MYMVKKPSTTTSISTKNGLSGEDDEPLASSEVQEFNSAVETLLHKIDRIEQSQGQLVNSTTKITDAIYDPSEGIFAKLAAQKLESYQQFSQLDTKMASVTAWQQFHDKSTADEDDKREKVDTKLAELSTSVESMKKSRALVWGITKWVLVALGGGGITLAFKYIGQYMFNLH